MAELKNPTQPPKPASPPSPAAPCHRSPPRYPDFYGKHRKQLELQILNREIGFLQEELQSVEDLKPVSRCCKEVDEFVGANPDSMIPPGKSSYNVSWLCCFRGCSLNFGKPSCASNPSKNCQRCCCYNSHCCSCLDKPSCQRCCCCNSHCCSCLDKPSCRSCCDLPSLSCPDCSCSCVCSCPECRKVCHCPRCARNCCLSSCLCV